MINLPVMGTKTRDGNVIKGGNTALFNSTHSVDTQEVSGISGVYGYRADPGRGGSVA